MMISKMRIALTMIMAMSFALVIGCGSENDKKAPVVPATGLVNGTAGTWVAAAVSSVVPQLAISWAAATDDNTASANLKYTVITSTDKTQVASLDAIMNSVNITVLADAVANKLSVTVPVGSVASPAPTLDAYGDSVQYCVNTIYYFAVVVEDYNGNASLYGPKGFGYATAVPITAGTIASPMASNTLSWSASTTVITLTNAAGSNGFVNEAADFQYKVVFTSTANALSAANAEKATGTAILQAYTTNITSLDLSPFIASGLLASGSSYNFYVLTKDSNNNIVGATSTSLEVQ
jgi:hypothetical protein